MREASIFERSFGVLAIATTCAFLLHVAAPFSVSAADQAASGTVEAPLPQFNPNALHRVDFRVTGKSCAICLHKIQERMKNLPGAVQAAVMLKKPYGAVVVYDSSKVTVKAILDEAIKGEPEVKTVDVKDQPIKKLPIVLIPVYSQVPNES